jgi:hypothetical protein
MLATKLGGNQPASNTQTPARRALRPNKIRSMRERKVFAATFRLCGSLALPKKGSLALRMMGAKIHPLRLTVASLACIA